ncbi:MAG: hypothetical protein JJU34_04530 [Lunatimonas sp.]|uniref:hypothetical protein n=1 Tax=Lunatimonas sp. TaxID=2060141 RepID=UPI00263B60E5|nr:hypothetical protein [Lunatimonas sp.]MCC5936524.1 hypothetical protein [Lunatimonas sp.]
MNTSRTSFFHPYELQSNTSVLTLSAYVFSGLIRIFEWPSALWYGVLVLLALNIVLIGKLMYDLGSKYEVSQTRAKVWAEVRLLINLALVFVAVYHMRLG